MTADDPFERAWQAQQAGDVHAAEEGYRKVLRSNPHDARVWFTLGQLCAAQGRLFEAVVHMRQALEIQPHEAGGYLHLGNTLLQDKRYAEAEAAYRRCLELAPNTVEALINLGFVLGELHRIDEARACYEQVRSLDPTVPEAHHNLGNILRDQGRLEEALACYDEALRLRPDYSKAQVNRGVALVFLGDAAEAVASMRRGVALEPDFAEAHNSLGTGLSALGRLDEAVASFERAIQLRPDYPDANWNRCLLRLLQGDYVRGWQEYEWRWSCKNFFQMPAVTQPRWDGSSLAGRTILLHAEQGLGDTLQFVRYAPLVQARGGRVILQCQGPLIPLLSRSAGIDELVAWGAPFPSCDVWSPLMSLPALFGTTLETIPASVPYLFADPVRIERWRRELAPLAGLKVGIAWRGSPQHPWDRHRSVPLASFAPLARIEGVRLISLQKGAGADELRQLAGAVIDPGEQVDRAGGAFMDTAAILHSLDLVICVDTAIAHLAGGMGIPLWLALHHTPDWRWLLQRDDSPWYPSARLFRQPTQGDWETVFRRITDELQELAARRKAAGSARAAQPLLIEVSPGELLDRITILRIKSERIADAARATNVRRELDSLAAAREALPPSPELDDLEKQLKEVNERLWDVEDAIRDCERRQDFGPAFIELARSVYLTNDRRAALKRAVNELLGSPLVEEKSYSPYTSG